MYVSLCFPFAPRYIPAGNSLLCTVPFRFISIELRSVKSIRKKLKYAHEVLFYVRTVARIHPERIQHSVKYAIWGYFDINAVVVLTLISIFIEFILWEIQVKSCFTLKNSSGNPLVFKL